MSLTAPATAASALLAAILANPGDDTPRLVYADWLEEAGDANRAAFIRLQCRIAAIQATCGCGSCVRRRGGGQHTNGPCGVDQERNELPDGRSKQAFLRMRERELWGGHTFAPPMPHNFRGRLDQAKENGDCLVRRGFPTAVVCTAAACLSHLDSILAVAPVEEVTLTTLPLASWGPGAGSASSRLCWFVGRLEVHIPYLENPFAAQHRIVSVLCKAYWPQVKVWHLPA